MPTILHVIFAVLSLSIASVNVFRPSEARLKTSYALALGTLASGALLIFVNNASILRTCITGLVFFAVVIALNQIARRKLAAAIISLK